jgi:hypothetical protein
MSELGSSRLKELMSYDPDTGLFCRLVKTSNRGPVGPVEGCEMHGYRGIRIDGRLYYSHRLAWLYMNGVWPSEIDHIDGNTANNRWSNLREVTSSQNKINRSCGKLNRNLPKGVIWHKKSKTMVRSD